MNNLEAARRSLERARLILEEAHRFYAQGAWNLVVRRSQEAVELALKGALLWAGLEVPRVRDVGFFLRRHRRRFPSSWAALIPRLASISGALGAERERSFYKDMRRWSRCWAGRLVQTGALRGCLCGSHTPRSVIQTDVTCRLAPYGIWEMV